MRRIPVLWLLLGLLVSLALVNYDLDLACRLSAQCDCSDDCLVCHASSDLHAVGLPAVAPDQVAMLEQLAPPPSPAPSPLRFDESEQLFYRHTVWKAPCGLRGPPPA